MTIDKQKLKALAEAATQSHGVRRVEVDHNGVHVIGDGSWKILSAWHTPDGKGSQNAEFAAAASPATVLAMLAEIERLETQVRLAGVAAEVTVHQEVGRAVTRELVLAHERDQLQAENEALRSGRAISRLTCAEVREAFNQAYYQPREIGSDGEQCRAGVLAVIDAAMAKEASRG